MAKREILIPYVHACIKLRKATNKILALKAGGNWLQHLLTIRHKVFMYFSKIFFDVT